MCHTDSLPEETRRFAEFAAALEEPEDDFKRVLWRRSVSRRMLFVFVFG
jgi:hypothetical protein